MCCRHPFMFSSDNAAAPYDRLQQHVINLRPNYANNKAADISGQDRADRADARHQMAPPIARNRPIKQLQSETLHRDVQNFSQGQKNVAHIRNARSVWVHPEGANQQRASASFQRNTDQPRAQTHFRRKDTALSTPLKS
ncbi:hypothetical protein ROHU_007235 [Labeo rohita]|uniref:Uncharacterized protein n=1 Tax=Labeo rohita TaxID=84645 RepID=A0A498MRG6_LABRO|nr:hypothetical protein ROHU_007235 [Labeo rohita]